MRDPSFDIYPICRHKSPRRNGRMEFPYGSSLHRCRSLHGTYFYMKIPMIATETVTAIGVCFVFLLLTLTYATTDRIWAKVWNCDVNVTASEEIPLSLGDIVSFLHDLCYSPRTWSHSPSARYRPNDEQILQKDTKHPFATVLCFPTALTAF